MWGRVRGRGARETLLLTPDYGAEHEEHDRDSRWPERVRWVWDGKGFGFAGFVVEPRGD